MRDSSHKDGRVGCFAPALPADTLTLLECSAMTEDQMPREVIDRIVAELQQRRR